MGPTMARPKRDSYTTTMRISNDIAAWAEFAGRDFNKSTAQYLDALMRADRARRMAEDADVARRYRLYCEALGADAELASLDAQEGGE